MNQLSQADRKQWAERAVKLLSYTRLAFELSLEGLPRITPCQVRLDEIVASFSTASEIERIEREIADVFFVRIRGLSESLLKELGKMNWESGTKTIAYIEKAIGCSLEFSPDDVELLEKLPRLRNVIAHADGGIDDKARKKLADLQAEDVWMNRHAVRNWFNLVDRLFHSIGAASPNG